MKITPLEIRQKSFEKAFRGVNKEEVNAFLLSLSHEWERMLDENKAHKIQSEKLEKEVQKLREVETTLFKTLKTAEDTGASVVEQARKTAELHLKETQINVDAMMNDTQMNARAIIEKAEAQAREILEEMHQEVKDLEENYRIIESQRDNVVSQLKIISGDVMSKVESIKYRDSGIEKHLARVKKMLRESGENVANIPVEKKIAIHNGQLKNPTEPQEQPDESIEEMKYVEPNNQQVKKNFIPEKNPILRSPANPKIKARETKIEKIAVPENEISFFDQLED